MSSSGGEKRSQKLRPITDIAARLGLSAEEVECYGPFKAKVSLPAIERALRHPPGKLIVITAITPTPLGEGKTTVGIGLAMALNHLGKRAVVCVREPSLGPLFGLKGGATGGGRATIEPAEDINLHFTGDLHAITSAQNLLAALVDNHLFQGNTLNIDPATAQARRCLDICDRSLRYIETHPDGKRSSSPVAAGFELTAACEVHATLTLAQSLSDLRRRLARIVVGFTPSGTPVTAGDLKATGALLALLRDALKPNLVQTCEGTPALVHLGPFGNLSCGNNSVIATKLGRHLADYTVTEAGFASELGLEKFCDLICRAGGFAPDAAVIVATIRALKYHGGVALDRLTEKNCRAVGEGFTNLQKHIENVKAFGLPCVVAINRFKDDDEDEIVLLKELCAEHGAKCATADVWARGGEGGIALAEAVVEATQQKSRFHFLYDVDAPLPQKIEKIARTLYGADGVQLLPPAQEKLAKWEAAGLDKLPLCVAKTHLSLSDNPKLLGRPSGFTVTVKDLRLMAGAGFIVCYLGDVLVMPGLPKVPAAERI
ncbi:MAG: formate--tetrahydrofolate ligase, partial [Abditibacteriales bacterium]|nr:formate--tetrahydrofolate ligase [Abditibacteriales bacterium]MDW8366518.1 formate--tetrahydrofolate ligase [Abditibacteriales bacterium]